MNARVIGLPILAVTLVFISGCAIDGQAVEEAVGFWPGLADGFLILYQFLSGYLDDRKYINRLQADTLYHVGYLSGAVAFLSLGALISRP